MLDIFVNNALSFDELEFPGKPDQPVSAFEWGIFCKQASFYVTSILYVFFMTILFSILFSYAN